MPRNNSPWRLDCFSSKRKHQISYAEPTSDLETAESSQSQQTRHPARLDATSPIAATNESVPNKLRNMTAWAQEPLNESQLWNCLSPSNELSCNRLRLELYHKRVYWPGGIHQYFLPVNVQDKLLTGPNISGELQYLFRHMPKEELKSLAGRICERARKVFAILLLRHKGASIVLLLDNDSVTDQDLPFIKDNNSYGFKLRTGKRITAFKDWDPQDIDDINREQWWLIAPVFNYQGEHKEIEDDCVLPFIEDSSNGKGGKGGNEGPGFNNSGGYSDVWGVQIHPAHQKFLRLYDPECPPPQIAVKRLHSTAATNFEQERDMLKTISEKDHPHIVKLLATYLYKRQYHFLFLWAPCNLRKYWERNLDSAWNTESMLWSIKQMEGLASGLCKVHNFLPAANNSLLQIPDDIRIAPDESKYGRHGDIKPENILWTDKLDGNGNGMMGILQLADFGLARFHREASRSNVKHQNAMASPTYEPPEIDLKRKISRAYDIWSLGCVFLEHITWCLGGCQLVYRFTQHRTVHIDEAFDDDKFFTVVNGGSVETAVVRKEVFEWADFLLKQPRCSEAMKDLLNIVIGKMLVIDAKGRINCITLEEELAAIRQKAENDDTFLLGRAPRTPLLDQNGFADAESISSNSITNEMNLPHQNDANDEIGDMQDPAIPQIITDDQDELPTTRRSARRVEDMVVGYRNHTDNS